MSVALGDGGQRRFQGCLGKELTTSGERRKAALQAMTIWLPSPWGLAGTERLQDEPQEDLTAPSGRRLGREATQSSEASPGLSLLDCPGKSGPLFLLHQKNAANQPLLSDFSV